MLYSVIIDTIVNSTNYQRYIGVSGRHNVKIMGFSYYQNADTGALINVFCPQLGNTTTTNTVAGRTFLSFIYDLNNFRHHYGSIDLGVRELNNFLDFTFTGTTPGTVAPAPVSSTTKFIIYLDINDARTEYPLLN